MLSSSRTERAYPGALPSESPRRGVRDRWRVDCPCCRARASSRRALVGVGGWRAIFLVNVPFVAAALALAWRAVPRRPGVVPDDRVRLAWCGASRRSSGRLGGARHRECATPLWRSLRGSQLLLVLARRLRAPRAAAPRPASSRASSRVRPSRLRTQGISSRTSPSTRSCSRPQSSSPAISTGRACRSGSLSHCSPPRWSSSPRSAVGWPSAYGRRMPAVAGCVALTAGIIPARDRTGPRARLPCFRASY